MASEQERRARLLSRKDAVRAFFERTSLRAPAEDGSDWLDAFRAVQKNDYLAESFVEELRALIECIERDFEAPSRSAAQQAFHEETTAIKAAPLRSSRAPAPPPPEDVPEWLDPGEESATRKVRATPSSQRPEPPRRAEPPAPPPRPARATPPAPPAPPAPPPSVARRSEPAPVARPVAATPARPAPPVAARPMSSPLPVRAPAPGAPVLRGLSSSGKPPSRLAPKSPAPARKAFDDGDTNVGASPFDDDAETTDRHDLPPEPRRRR